jgi:hypothetical protein
MRSTMPAMSAALALAALATTARAQTRDQARIAFTIMGGYVLPRELWSVDRQPVFDAPFPSDTFRLGRRIRPTVSFGFSGIYFPGNHVGWTGEAYLIGLGFEDRCTEVYASGSGRNSRVCQSIDQGEKAATAVALNGGLIYRVASRAVISPYLRLAAGVLFTTQSSVRMVGQFPSAETGELADVTIYPDDHDSRVAPTGVLGLGFTSAVGHGYQLRWEVRDNIAAVRAVTGATLVDGTPPPTATRIKHLISLNVGFDVVLERRRGHRY